MGNSKVVIDAIADVVVTQDNDTAKLDGYIIHIITDCMECGAELPFPVILNAPEDLQGVSVKCADD